jgi:mandelamide amidase
MTRSVADCVLIDGVVTGGPLEVAPASLQGLRIGVPHQHFWDNLDPKLGEICESALQRLSQAGVTLVDVNMSEEAKLERRGRIPDRALRDGHRPQPISEGSRCGR